MKLTLFLCLVLLVCFFIGCMGTDDDDDDNDDDSPADLCDAAYTEADGLCFILLGQERLDRRGYFCHEIEGRAQNFTGCWNEYREDILQDDACRVAESIVECKPCIDFMLCYEDWTP